QLQLFSATANGLPGSRIATFSGSSAPVVAGNYRYVAPATLKVNPDTSYYLVLTAARVPGFQNDEFLWYRSTQATGVSSDGWTVGDLVYSINGGAWTRDAFGFLPGTFLIEGVAVPEPSLTALFAVGVVPLLGYRRLKNRRQCMTGHLWSRRKRLSGGIVFR